MGEPILKDGRLAEDMTGSSAARARYEDDFDSWLLEQADLLRSGRLGDLDLDHVAEELKRLSRKEFAKLQSCLRVLVMHMLEWNQQPEHRTPSWTSFHPRVPYAWDDILDRPLDFDSVKR